MTSRQSRWRMGHVWLWLGCWLLPTVSAPAQLVPPEEEEDFPYRTGLVAQYQAAGRQIQRRDALLAFDWEDGACDPRLPPGPFSASWRGRLWTREEGSYRLFCYVQGRVQLRLGDRTLLKGEAAMPQWLASPPVELPFDFHPLEVEYERTAPTGRLTLYWSGPGFLLEPVPARFLLHERNLSPFNDFERGRLLAQALRCAACHREEKTPPLPAPALDRLAGNLQPQWLREWLTASPAPSADTEATANSVLRKMPHFFLQPEQVEALAAWLLAPSKSNTPAVEDKSRLDKKQIKKSSNNILPAGNSRAGGAGETAGPKQTPGDAAKSSPKKARQTRREPTAEDGATLVQTRGCLACHTLGERGHSGWFGGGDLGQLARKRPAGFLTRWLTDPAAINRDHRMPSFVFTAEEEAALALWDAASRAVVARAAASASGRSPPEAPAAASPRNNLQQEGAALALQYRCGACHALPDGTPAPTPLAPLQADSDWSRSCAGSFSGRRPDQPVYALGEDDRSALRAYFSTARPGAGDLPPAARGYELLVQHNCLACHLREEADRQVLRPLLPLAEQFAALAQQQPELAPQLPAMTPPALHSVGDKLHEAALREAIRRQGPMHRDYLLVRMPRFSLTDEQLDALVHYFLACDRIPEPPPAPADATARDSRADPAVRRPEEPPAAPASASLDAATLAVAGARLVTTDGLSCTSCHQVGSLVPDKAPLNARGPSLSMLGQRIRRVWFDRWCADPARIVPRMEMPSVKVPVRGVLDERVETQLAAVWQVLNTPGFEPPPPHPVRVLRHSGEPRAGQPAVVVHDVVKTRDETYLFPLVIGLPNRHNLLIDLATGSPALWWLGDVARQRTSGKSWYWEPGGVTYPLNRSRDFTPTLELGGRRWRPVPGGERIEIDRLELGESVQWHYVLRYPLDEQGKHSIFVRVRQRWSVPEEAPTAGVDGTWEWLGLPDNSTVHLQLVDAELASQCRWDSVERTLHLPWPGGFSLRVADPDDAEWDGRGGLQFSTPAARAAPPPAGAGAIRLRLKYRTRLVPDRFLTPPPAGPPPQVQDLQLAPGFAARRLPLPAEIMPSGLAWDARGRLVFCTLKGEVFRAEDRDGDGCEERLELLWDGLPTPYGIAVPPAPAGQADAAPIDVLVKTGLFRLWPAEAQRAEDHAGGPVLQRLASGWGCTDDYHDWAVGLVRDEAGAYYIALPCQQDQRSELAARYRGQVVKLVPRPGSPIQPPQYDLEVLSAGHRFPMGLARQRDGALLVTDNQGNYNPFNELNHVRPGAHFGFINALEKQRGVIPPPLTPPAIDIPHPWTRSVNGICFLDTPDALRREGIPPLFGPLEGHLIGCEYDTRRLIRMTLQAVGDTYQGAAYPLSMPPVQVEQGLLGPIVCAVSPQGALYVGEVRDSGWGAGNNIGQITKIQIDPAQLPCGIAEVRATRDGFELDFFRPVDRQRARDPANYRIESYRRQSTPAYGGPDLDRRAEVLAGIAVSEDARQVRLTLPSLRAGFVYEFKLRNLSPDGGLFHPDEAHYTLRQLLP